MSLYKNVFSGLVFTLVFLLIVSLPEVSVAAGRLLQPSAMRRTCWTGSYRKEIKSWHLL